MPTRTQSRLALMPLFVIVAWAVTGAWTLYLDRRERNLAAELELATMQLKVIDARHAELHARSLGDRRETKNVVATNSARLDAVEKRVAALERGR